MNADICFFQSYYEMGDREMAVSTMKNAFESHPDFVTSEGRYICH